ncbi:hypothetical protein B0H15DRAFT_797364 [Mycena belliarum]|uniref:Uncharacterized protein n=1 Tax=Mycena belliarum TaxID=1033014 RepID=A0AAD6UDB3_9AGAR|nr:hypothetical protein B0H15DRAFT_797364 [Mycena belliae]
MPRYETFNWLGFRNSQCGISLRLHPKLTPSRNLEAGPLQIRLPSQTNAFLRSGHRGLFKLQTLCCVPECKIRSSLFRFDFAHIYPYPLVSEAKSTALVASALPRALAAPGPEPAGICEDPTIASMPSERFPPALRSQCPGTRLGIAIFKRSTLDMIGAALDAAGSQRRGPARKTTQQRRIASATQRGARGCPDARAEPDSGSAQDSSGAGLHARLPAPTPSNASWIAATPRPFARAYAIERRGSGRADRGAGREWAACTRCGTPTGLAMGLKNENENENASASGTAGGGPFVRPAPRRKSARRRQPEGCAVQPRDGRDPNARGHGERKGGGPAQKVRRGRGGTGRRAKAGAGSGEGLQGWRGA